MWTALVICLFLATSFQATSFARSLSATSSSTLTTAALASSLSEDATTSSSIFDVDDELTKIAASCLSRRNRERLGGNIVRGTVARILSDPLVRESVDTIGLTELRAALHFAPVRPWQPFNRTEPSEDELASAPSLEAYYDLREPSSFERSLDCNYFFEHNLTPAIAYLDKRFPSIRHP